MSWKFKSTDCQVVEEISLWTLSGVQSHFGAERATGICEEEPGKLKTPVANRVIHDKELSRPKSRVLGPRSSVLHDAKIMPQNKSQIKLRRSLVFVSLTASVTGYLEEEDLEIGLGTCPVMENLLNCTHSSSVPSPTNGSWIKCFQLYDKRESLNFPIGLFSFTKEYL